MFDFDVITGPTSSRPLAPAAKALQEKSDRAADQVSAGKPGRPQIAGADALALQPAPPPRR